MAYRPEDQGPIPHRDVTYGGLDDSAPVPSRVAGIEDHGHHHQYDIEETTYLNDPDATTYIPAISEQIIEPAYHDSAVPPQPKRPRMVVDPHAQATTYIPRIGQQQEVQAQTQRPQFREKKDMVDGILCSYLVNEDGNYVDGSIRPLEQTQQPDAHMSFKRFGGRMEIALGGNDPQEMHGHVDAVRQALLAIQNIAGQPIVTTSSAHTQIPSTPIPTDTAPAAYSHVPTQTPQIRPPIFEKSYHGSEDMILREPIRDDQPFSTRTHPEEKLSLRGEWRTWKQTILGRLVIGTIFVTGALVAADNVGKIGGTIAHHPTRAMNTSTYTSWNLNPYHAISDIKKRP